MAQSRTGHEKEQGVSRGLEAGGRFGKAPRPGVDKNKVEPRQDLEGRGLGGVKKGAPTSLRTQIPLDGARMWTHTHTHTHPKADFGPALEALLKCSKEIPSCPTPVTHELASV